MCGIAGFVSPDLLTEMSIATHAKRAPCWTACVA